jgi:hypothetical protein
VDFQTPVKLPSIIIEQGSDVAEFVTNMPLFGSVPGVMTGG